MEELLHEGQGWSCIPTRTTRHKAPASNVTVAGPDDVIRSNISVRASGCPLEK